MLVKDAIDVSVMLRLGVYLLSHNGIVVYVGKSKCPLARIAAHRSLARRKQVWWLPVKGIVFDAVQVIPAHPDRVDALEVGLISLYKPRYNTQHNSPGPTTEPFELTIGSTRLQVGSRPSTPIYTQRL